MSSPYPALIPPTSCRRADPRICEQVVDQRLHPFRTVYGKSDKIVGVGVEFAKVSPLENLRVAYRMLGLGYS